MAHLYTNLLKLKEAPYYMQCGDKAEPSGACAPDGTRINCVYYASSANETTNDCPPGYSFYNWTKGGATCGGSNYARMCVKNYNDPHWEGEIANAIFNETTDADIINKAFDCCTNAVYGRASEIKKCGTLYSGEDDTTTANCNRVFKKYCLSGDNINKPRCKSQINMYPEFKLRLSEICPSKVGSSEWDEVCACYYGYNYYDKLATAVEKEWQGPAGGIKRFPECINPKCTSNTYRNKDNDNKCGEVSFTKCVQNANINLTDSNVSNIKISQDTSCKRTFATNANSSTSSTNTGGDNSGSSGNTSVDEDDKDVNNDTKIKILITIIIIFVAGLLGYFYLASGSGEYYADEYYADEYYGGVVTPLTAM